MLKIKFFGFVACAIDRYSLLLQRLKLWGGTLRRKLRLLHKKAFTGRFGFDAIESRKFRTYSRTKQRETPHRGVFIAFMLIRYIKKTCREKGPGVHIHSRGASVVRFEYVGMREPYSMERATGYGLHVFCVRHTTTLQLAMLEARGRFKHSN